LIAEKEMKTRVVKGKNSRGNNAKAERSERKNEEKSILSIEE